MPSTPTPAPPELTGELCRKLAEAVDKGGHHEVTAAKLLVAFFGECRPDTIGPVVRLLDLYGFATVRNMLSGLRDHGHGPPSDFDYDEVKRAEIRARVARGAVSIA